MNDQVVVLACDVYSLNNKKIANKGEKVNVLYNDKNGVMVEKKDKSRSFYVDHKEIAK